jgi:hypothetical protein
MIDPRRLRCANHEGRQIRPVVGGGAAVPDRRKADAQSRAPKVTLASLSDHLIQYRQKHFERFAAPARTARAAKSATVAVRTGRSRGSVGRTE